jgi:hypothetical protein
MTSLQIDSVEEPFRSDPELTAAAVKLLYTSEYTGLLPRGDVRSLDLELLSSVGDAMGAGQASVVAVEVKKVGRLLTRAGTDDQVRRYQSLLERLQEEVEASPRPDGEWAPVLDTLGEELVAKLVGTSVSSVRRYRSGERTTPQDVAERLHFLALVLGELAGSYNDYGMRRWFSRPRAVLDGKAPDDFMGKDFDPDGPAGDRIRALAEGLRVA